MMNEDERTDIVTLKVSGGTFTHALRSAILGNINVGKTIYVDCIGATANYVAIKAIITSRGILSTERKTLEATPYYHDIKLDKTTDGVSIKTAVRWILEQKDI